MDKMQIMNKILLLFIIMVFESCFSQNKKKDININFLLDYYIDYYSGNKKDFNSKNKYILLGINEEKDNPDKKNIYINDNCFNCEGRINSNDTIVLYRGYELVIFNDNERNKKFLLKKIKNYSFTSGFSLKTPDPNIISDVGGWTFKFDESGTIIFFCNTKYMEKYELIKEIKEKLNISNVDDCVTPFIK